jgi:hypothetical protein
MDIPRVGTAAAGADEIARIGVNHLPFKLFVESIKFVPDTAVTASDANNGTLTIKIGATTIATFVTNVAQGNLVAGTVYTITPSASGADLEISVNEAFSAAKTYTGSGAVLSGIVSFQCSELRS